MLAMLSPLLEITYPRYFCSFVFSMFTNPLKVSIVGLPTIDHQLVIYHIFCVFQPGTLNPTQELLLISSRVNISTLHCVTFISATRILQFSISPEEGGASELQISKYCFADSFCQFFHTTYQIYTIKVHVAWEHSSFKNVDLVVIQSSDPRAWIFNWSIFGNILYFPLKSLEGYKNVNKKRKLSICCQWSQMSPF